jgi:Mycobacterium 19 kDa lipoprotein antigen
MSDRWIWVAAAAVVPAAWVAGCSQQPQVAPESSADVSIDHATTRVHSVSCSQYQWFWTIDVGDEMHGAEALMQRSGLAYR